MVLFNQSIQVLTIVWNEKRFVESKSARLAARRSVYRAGNILLQADLRNLENQNNEIRHETQRCNQDLHKYDEKLQILDNMTQLATQSLEVYFQARMENLRTFVSEQCRIISEGIQEEADHWKEIHAMLQQKLVVPGDLRSYGGGNGLPRGVKQSPNFSRILEEEEEEEDEEAAESEYDRTIRDEEKRGDVSLILQSRTLTPLITQSLKKARLRASKVFHETSRLNMSTTIVEEEEAAPPTNHMTLGDVSAIAKENEMETDLPPADDLSVSLLPFLPSTTHSDEEKQHNKSVGSTISDKTFVKKSLKPIITEEEEEEEEAEADETLMEESFNFEKIDKSRPLLLTADQSIRLTARRSSRKEKISLANEMNSEKVKIKQEKLSYREPMENNPLIEKSRPGKTLLPTNPTFKAEKSEFIRPTIVVTNDTSKLSPIASEESENEENERPAKKSTDEVLSTSSRSRTTKSPSVNQLAPPENTTKRRTTRRTTIRLLQENANVEVPSKTRYATRYSTRLASAMITEETSTIVSTRRTTRLSSE